MYAVTIVCIAAPFKVATSVYGPALLQCLVNAAVETAERRRRRRRRRDATRSGRGPNFSRPHSIHRPSAFAVSALTGVNRRECVFVPVCAVVQLYYHCAQMLAMPIYHFPFYCKLIIRTLFRSVQTAVTGCP